MPIKYIIENERCGPYIICDYCGEKITKMDGNVYWRHEDAEKGSELFFAHKKCNKLFEKTTGRLSSETLTNLPIRLATNIGMDIEITKDSSPLYEYNLRGKILSFG